MKWKKTLLVGFIAVWVLVFVLTSLRVPGRALAAESVTAPEETHGLKAEYYLNSGAPNFTFGELKSTIIDPNIDFGSLEGVFSALTGRNDRVSVRWTGFIQPETTENYTFSIIGDNGFRLWIDNKLVIDHWVDDWDKEQTGAPLALTAGQKHEFKLEYFENNGGSNLHLRWSSPRVPKQAVPTQAFYPPAGFDYGGTVATDGSTAEVVLSEPLQELPAGLTEHLRIQVVGVDWPIASASLKPGEPHVIMLSFAYPIYSKDVWLVRAGYDGRGGLNTRDGAAVAAFDVQLKNRSTYQITTPWAAEVNPENVLPDYPRPQLVRGQWANLNGEWEFEAAKEDDAVPTGRTLGEKILVPFAAESVLSGINRVEDRMWYKRSFTVPDSWSGQRVNLNFGAVDYLATVYVNGKLIGSHKGGYTSFSFDITDALVSGSNELIVHVLDQTDMGEDQAVGKQTVKKLGGIWYTSVSGIWQTVWLEPVANAHIEKLDMTPDLQSQALKLTPAVQGAPGLTVEAVAKVGGEIVGRVTGAAGETLQLPVPNPRLWSPDDPFLYDLTVRLKNGEQVADEVTSYFGMREIKLGMEDGVLRPLLNGKFVFQMGPLDQGYYPDGLYTAPTDEALKFDLQTVKRVGMNMVRKHIKVEPARWYYWADKLGVLVWQDMPSLEDRQGNRGSDITPATKTQWLKEYKEMVDQLRSAPSIVVWTVFNEGWGQFDWGGQQTRDAANYVKGLDSTRLINNTSGWQDSGAGDLIDAHAYPAPTSPTPTQTRAAVLGEYGGLGLHVPGHEWSPLVFSYQLMNSKQELTDKYVQFIDRLKQLKQSPGLSAAIYTQITDVEYEINGLLSYDRKVEKLDFNRIAKAHRELIGGVTREDLIDELQLAEQLLSRLQAGDGAGQYPQEAIAAYRSTVDAAKAVSMNGSSTANDWIHAMNALKAAKWQLVVSVNDPIPQGAVTDSFATGTLDPAWSIYREDAARWSLTAKPGSLRLQTLSGDSHQTSNSLKNVFLRKAPEGDFAITTKVTAPVAKNHQQAGLIIWQNEDNYVRLGHVWDTVGSTGKSLETAVERNAVYTKATNMAKHPGTDTVYLQIKKTGNVYTTHYWDGAAWAPAADPVQADLTNLQIGFYGLSAGDNTSMTADFDYFSVGAPVQAQPKASLTGPAVVGSGQSFDLTYSLSDVAGNVYGSVYAQDVTVGFDPSKLELTDAVSVKDGFSLLEKRELEPGKVRMVGASLGGGAEANGAWLKLSFKAKPTAAPGSAYTSIQLSGIAIADRTGVETTIPGTTHQLQVTAEAPDKSDLNEAIAAAQAKVDAAVEDLRHGYYLPGSRAAMQVIIAQAAIVANDAEATQQQITEALNALTTAMLAFEGRKINADLNGNGSISIGDLAIIASHYGKQQGDSGWSATADLNQDGKVDIQDLTTVARSVLQ